VTTPDPVELSAAQWRLLADGFRGPRPGSNALALLGLTHAGVTITGEEIGRLLTAGLLEARPVHGQVEVLPGSDGPAGEIPEVEMTHNYALSGAGRALMRAQTAAK
jgi:hypothetical protein